MIERLFSRAHHGSRCSSSVFFLGLRCSRKDPPPSFSLVAPSFSGRRSQNGGATRFDAFIPSAIATFCLTALPWYIACAQRNPDFFRVFIIEHNFKRFLTPEFQHVQPFWYYIPVVLVAFLPWTPAVLISVTFEIRRYLRGYRVSPSTLFFLCWALFCLLFFSISKSKLPGYILPAVPGIGMLLTKSYVYMTSQQSRVFRWIEFGIGILVAALGIALVSISFDQSTISKEVLLSEGWVIAGLGIANALLGIRRRKTFLSCNLASLCVVPVLILLGCFNLLRPHFMAEDPFRQDSCRRTHCESEFHSMRFMLRTCIAANCSA